MRMRSILGSSSLFLVLAIGCGDDKGTGDSETDTGTAGTADTGESGSMSMTGDGDGDTTPETGDGDGDTDPDVGDGDGDGDGCTVGSEGCPCTAGGGCDPGLICDAGVCGPAPGDGDGDGGDGDGDGDPDAGDGDGDGDGGDGDGDGGPGVPYQACPNGDDDCAPGETCSTGTTMQGLEWTLCTMQCFAPDECAVDDVDSCANIPGDGLQENFCLPVVNCNFGNPCPMGMQCIPGFNGGPSVCVWPL
jgi:hypothetical protein